MSVLFAKGFLASGVASGIKESGDLDLSLVAVSGGEPASAAATFTQNRAAAAPVQVSQSNLKRTAGGIRAVIVSSGNANAATGHKGLEDARTMCALVAAGLGCESSEILVCSTGLIGIPMPSEKLVSAIPGLVDSLGDSDGHAMNAARAMMTTDTRPKLVEVEGTNFRIGGMAKGAAMLAPNMATMLAVLTTDAKVSRDTLSLSLRTAVEGSFNKLVIDGCTSTNDTVVCLSSGAAGDVEPEEFGESLASACRSLAMQMALDAEGVHKVVTVRVTGASSAADADKAARKIAASQLVQCSFYGSDPYWGRLASEAGSSGAEFEMDLFSASYGGVDVARSGVSVNFDADELARVMNQDSLSVVCDLGLGNGEAEVITTDLSPEYIAENMRTS